MLLTIMLAGHGLTLGLMLIIWRRIDKIEERMDSRLTKIENDMMAIKFDLIEIKTMLRMKECCMINDERQMKKVE